MNRTLNGRRFSRDVECAFCDIPLTTDHEYCPKSGEYVVVDRILTVDAVHSGETMVEARRKIYDGLNVVLMNRLAGLRVIHGHGAARGHGSLLKPKILSLLRSIAERYGAELLPLPRNPGAHLLLFNDQHNC